MYNYEIAFLLLSMRDEEGILFGVSIFEVLTWALLYVVQCRIS